MKVLKTEILPLLPPIILAVNESTVIMKTLGSHFNERIDREMSTIVETVEDRVQNGILTAIDNLVASKI